jgi:hypothetical protein
MLHTQTNNLSLGDGIRDIHETTLVHPRATAFEVVDEGASSHGVQEGAFNNIGGCYSNVHIQGPCG